MKKKIILILVINFTLSILLVNSSWAKKSDIKLVADFDKGGNRTNLGTKFNAWDKDKKDPSQSCQIAFSSKVKVGKKGKSLKITYDVDSTNPAFNGISVALKHIKGHKRKKLTFYVKGDEQSGFTTTFKIELKGYTAKRQVTEGYHVITNVTKDWQKIEIPLTNFNLSDYRALWQLVFVFSDSQVTAKTGVLYLDNIAFE